MKRSTAVLGALLALSLLFNAVAFVRLQETPPPVAPPPAPRPPRTEVPTSAAPIPAVSMPVARPADPLVVVSPPPPAKPNVVKDPQVLDVLEAQDDFGILWKELDRVFKARGKLDEAAYAQTVLTAVGEFLGMSTASRAAFAEALQAGAASLAAARAEHQAAKDALPPKDKSNVASLAVYQQQKDAIDLRYQERAKAAIDGVKSHLDLRQPRHAELAGNLEKLLRNLAPR